MSQNGVEEGCSGAKGPDEEADSDSAQVTFTAESESDLSAEDRKAAVALLVRRSPFLQKAKVNNAVATMMEVNTAVTKASTVQVESARKCNKK